MEAVMELWVIGVYVQVGCVRGCSRRSIGVRFPPGPDAIVSGNITHNNWVRGGDVTIRDAESTVLIDKIMLLHYTGPFRVLARSLNPIKHERQDL